VSLNAGFSKRGFTLVEVLVAVFMLGVAFTALVGALSGLTRAERAVQEKDLVDRLATRKLEELIATEAWRSESGGSFDEARHSDYTWSLEQVDTGVPNVVGLRLEVTSLNKGEASAETLLYDPPAEGGATGP